MPNPGRDDEQPSNVPGITSEDIVEILGPDADEEEVRKLVAYMRQASYSGPLPMPEHFAAYADILGDDGNRIMSMAEQEQKIRHEVMKHEIEMEDRVVENDIALSKRGQWMAFSIISFLTAGGFAGLMLDKPVAGFASLATAVVTSLVNIFGAKYTRWRGERLQGREERSGE